MYETIRLAWNRARPTDRVVMSAAPFFVLLTLSITLFDRYRHVRAARAELDAPGGHAEELAVTPG